VAYHDGSSKIVVEPSIYNSDMLNSEFHRKDYAAYEAALEKLEQ